MTIENITINTDIIESVDCSISANIDHEVVSLGIDNYDNYYYSLIMHAVLSENGESLCLDTETYNTLISIATDHPPTEFSQP